jgi:1,4-alpha-glucan branching enzyme
MVCQEADGTVHFSFLRPDAEGVSLSGDFNGWHKSSMPMSRDQNGWWRYRFRMAPGTYQFRYLSDGQWFTDYAAFGLERGPFGWNSVLKVDPPAARTASEVQRAS